MGERLLIGMLQWYRAWIAPLLPPSCRYTPSCSRYMQEAVSKHGCVQGVWLGIKRLLRCHPFHPNHGGVDPVP